VHLDTFDDCEPGYGLNAFLQVSSWAVMMPTSSFQVDGAMLVVDVQMRIAYWQEFSHGMVVVQ
jgi:hypothetical protein